MKSDKRSLRRQTLIIIMLLVLPFNILTAFLGGIMLTNAMESAELTVQSSLNSQLDNLDMRIQNTIYFLYDYPANHVSYINFLKQPRDWHYTFYRSLTVNELRDDLSLSTAAQYMFLYVESRDDLIIMNEEPYIRNESKLLLSEDDVLSRINDKTISDSRWHLVSIQDLPFLIMITQKEGVYLGACICMAEAVSEAAASLEYDNVSIYASVSPNADTSSGIHCFAKSSKTNVYLCCDIPQNEIIGGMAFIHRGIIYLVILSFLIFPILSFFFNRYVNAPLANIRNAFAELEKGNDDYRITAVTNLSEFSDTYDSFNRMAEKLKELLLETIQKEQQRQQLVVDNLQLQLNYLQLQIRPHFLHNNMNLLYTLIQNNQTDAAQSLVLYLSDYFRYMFRKGHDRALFDHEMKLIREYLDISRLHYPDAFTFSCQIDPLLSHVRIPPLLLHGFVENIIQHALVPDHTVHIIIYGEYEDGIVTIQIADDGIGMNEEDTALINSGDFSSSPEGSHVGIKNAVLRLKHFYGEKSSITVESEPDSGTIFTITIPYNLTEVSDDEFINGE